MNCSRLLVFISCSAALLILWGCANPVAPDGGPKDTRPPKVMNFDPPNNSANFKENSIKVDFNEFIVLKNQATELNISPPLKHVPDLRLRGKSLVIKLDDTLAANTTYSIDFGKCITDLTENNPLTGLSYVFSTGPYIDSLSLRGVVVNAFDHTPPKDVYAMLYIDNSDTIVFDSLPIKVKPYYLVKTNENGEFLFHNLKSAPMKLTALSDQNGNLIFDQASEKVAFCDSIVHPMFVPLPKHDTSSAKTDSNKIKKDSANSTLKVKKVPPVKKLTAADSLKKDSLRRDSLFKASPLPKNLLFLFDDIDSIQRIQKTVVVKKGLVLITFRFPSKDIGLKPLNIDSSKTWSLQELSPRRDSLYLWLTSPYPDSLVLMVSQNNKVLDTLKLELNSKDDKASAKKKDQEKVFLGFSNNTSGPMLNQYAGNNLLTFSYPLSSASLKRIRLIQDKDTLVPKIYFADSLRRRLVIETKWKEDKSYSVFIPDSVFIAINGLANDTIKYNFKTRLAREFGNLILEVDLSKRPGDYIIQLLNERDAVIGETKINKNTTVRFEYLNPGKFKVKAVYDRNKNGKWDTGNFRKKIQPEEVFFFQKIIEIRANWDVEEKWAPASAF
ncbi:MAG: Ig-like domain-containing protein [Bacteroidota bacterium]